MLARFLAAILFLIPLGACFAQELRPAPRKLDLSRNAQHHPLGAHAPWGAWSGRHPGWRALIDTRGDIAAAFGPAVTVASASPSAHDVRAAAGIIGATLASDAGLPEGSFAIDAVRRGASMWYVHLQRMIAGLPVFDSQLSLRIDLQGRLVAWRGSLHALEPAEARPLIGPEAAVHAVRDFLETRDLLVPGAALEVIGVEACWRADGRVARASFRVDALPTAGRGAWSAVVDRTGGDVIFAWDNAVGCMECEEQAAAVSGTVGGTTLDGLEPGNVPVSSVLRDVHVTVAGVQTTSDGNGDYSVTAGPSVVNVTSALDGPYVTINDFVDPAPGFSASTASGTLNVSFDDTNSTLQQRNTVFHINKIHAYLKERLPTFTDLDFPIEMRLNDSTNLGGNCNGTYNPFSNHISLGPGDTNCVAWGYLGTMAMHEYGHAITWEAYDVNTAFTTTIYEGLADVAAAITEGNPSLGAGWLGPGTEIRNLDNNGQYPIPGAGAHAQGEIYGAGMWHTRDGFIARYGTPGAESFDTMFFAHQLGRPGNEIESIFEMLLLDDDDGDLTNGTPNTDLFHFGFAVRHGIPLPIEFSEITHSPLVRTQDQLQDHVVEALVDLVGGASPAAVACHWRLAGTGSYQTVTLSPAGGNRYIGAIPHQGAGHQVEYWLSATDTQGFERRLPHFGLENDPFSFVTRRDDIFFFDDFETSSGWTTGSFSGTANDWQWGMPQTAAHPYDPSSAFSGTKVRGNDIGLLGGDGFHASNFQNWLRSPTIDCTGRTGVHLVYRRWLTSVEQAVATIDLQIGAAPWTTVWSSTAVAPWRVIDRRWREHRVDISSIADGQSQVRVRFTMGSTQVPPTGGWTLDDISLAADAGPVLTTSGSPIAGQIFSLEVNGTPGDLYVLGADTSIAGTYYPGLGALSVNGFSPTFAIIGAAAVPASGQEVFSAVLPPLVGFTVHAQAVLLHLSTTTEYTISNLVTLTIQ